MTDLRSPTPRGAARAGGAGAIRADDKTREDFQTRLATLFKLMFWSLSALIGFLSGMYLIYPATAHHPDLVLLGSAAGLGTMAVIWVLLVRRPLSLAALYRIDLIYSVGIGAAFGASAYLQRELRPSAYASLLYSAFTVYARALIVPSSARRTAVASIATFVPMTASAAVLALTTPEDLPGKGFFLSYVLLSIVPIWLSAAGSRTIYGLRRQVSAAKQLGQYTLVRQIGQGGMGTVHLATHVMLRRPTAVKLLRPERVGADNLKRFEDEVQFTSQLTHPNTVAVFDYGHHPDGTFYYAMEYLGDGIALDRLVQRFGPQPSGRVVAILVQVCGALQEAHDKGFVHRDIKPGNIILCERGGVPDFVKVVDFGLVKEVTADTGASAQVVFGTPGYLPPEAVTDPSSVGPAFDLYALGAVGYYLVTGRRVFEGKTDLDVCVQHVTQQPRPPSEVAPVRVAPALEAILLRCLAKRPEDRFPSAEALAAALADVAAPDWDALEARRWWRDFQHSAPAPEAESSTMTITVDLGHRAASAGVNNA